MYDLIKCDMASSNQHYELLSEKRQFDLPVSTLLYFFLFAKHFYYYMYIVDLYLLSLENVHISTCTIYMIQHK